MVRVSSSTASLVSYQGRFCVSHSCLCWPIPARTYSQSDYGAISMHFAENPSDCII